MNVPGGGNPIDWAWVDDADVMPGVTHQEHNQYMNAHCEQLAWALNKATGWPIVVVAIPEEDQDQERGYDEMPGGVTVWNPTRDIFWVHAGVLRPDGKIVDVSGVSDLVDWLEDSAEGAEMDDEGSEADVALITDYAGQLRRDPTCVSPEEWATADRVAAVVLSNPDHASGGS